MSFFTRATLLLVLITSLNAGSLAAAMPSAPTTQPPAISAATIELWPFVVIVEKDKGYAVTLTLSGTRLATDLRDTASSLSIMADTDDFGVFGKPGEMRLVGCALQRPRTYALSVDAKF